MGHKIITLLLLLGIGFWEGSCQNATESKALQTMESFIRAWQQHDVALMESLYPGVASMDYFYSSNQAKIVEVKLTDHQKVHIRINSLFVTRTQQEVQRRIIFVLEPHSKHPDTMVITDSYGLACWERYPYYRFAVHTGCIPTQQMKSDMELSRRMSQAKQMVFVYTKAMYDRLSDDVYIIENNITSNDKRHTEGTAVVINSSPFHLPGLQYSIIFYNEAQQEMARTQDWVTHDVLPAGQKCTFHYAADILPGVTLMHFVLDFNVEMIVDYVLDFDNYTGKEYEAFLRRLNKVTTTPAKQVSGQKTPFHAPTPPLKPKKSITDAKF